MSARRYEGQVVAITGAAGGIGSALARRFAAEGARVALLDLDETGAIACAAAIDEASRAMGLACDVTDPASCARAFAAAREALGPVSVLVNNAGITHRSVLADTSTRVVERVMAVNFYGALHATQAALHDLIATRGRIAVLSSVAGFAPLVARAGYAASKHALHGLFGSLRAELAPSGVSVTLVCPSFTDTAIGHRALGGDGAPARAPWSPIGRPLAPDTVARAIAHATWRRRRLAPIGRLAHLSLLLSRLTPRLYDRLMTRSQRAELDAASGGAPEFETRRHGGTESTSTRGRSMR